MLNHKTSHPSIPAGAENTLANFALTLAPSTPSSEWVPGVMQGLWLAKYVWCVRSKPTQRSDNMSSGLFSVG